MPVTDEQVLTLRAFLVFDPVYERLTRGLADSGRWQGLTELVSSAFVTAAARRRFAPTWTSAQIDHGPVASCHTPTTTRRDMNRHGVRRCPCSSSFRGPTAGSTMAKGTTSIVLAEQREPETILAHRLRSAGSAAAGGGGDPALHHRPGQPGPHRVHLPGRAARRQLPAIAHATADFRPCGEAGGRRLRPSYLTGRIAQSRAGYRVLRRLGSGRAGPGPGPIVAARRQAAPAAGAGPGLGLRRGGPQEHMTAEGASHRPHQNPSGRTNHGSRSGNPFAHPDEGARRAGAVSLGCRKGRAAQQ